MRGASLKELMTAIVIGVALVSQVIWWAYHQLESVEHQIELEQQLNLSKQHFVAHELGHQYQERPIPNPLVVTERYPDVQLLPGREQDQELLRLMGPSGAFYHLAPSGEFNHRLAALELREKRMFLSEAAFFVVVIVVGISLLYGAYRRERDFARRQELFISTISHELNTPLAAISLTVDSMMRRSEFQPGEKYLQRLRNSARRLSQIVRTVLDAQWVEALSRTFDLYEFELLPVVSEALAYIRGGESLPEAEVELSIPSDLVVCSDTRAVHLVVCNLVRNAIQYGGEPPRVRVEAGRNGRHWWLRVEDNGAGIPLAERRSVFERFYRRSNHSAAKAGTGLGLYLVRRIARTLRGSVRLDESPALGGARFTVIFKEVRKCPIAW